MSNTDPRFFKDPAIAVVLSFFWTGVGHLYNGQFTKGFVLIVLTALSVWSMVLLIGFITTPLLWLYGMWDAYNSAKEINADLA